MLSDHHVLSSRYETLAERLSEGYATQRPSFRDIALGSGSGLEQGLWLTMRRWVRPRSGVHEISLVSTILGSSYSVPSSGSDRVKSAQAMSPPGVRWVDPTAWWGPLLLPGPLSEPDWPYIGHGASGACARKRRSQRTAAEEVLQVDQLLGDADAHLRPRRPTDDCGSLPLRLGRTSAKMASVTAQRVSSTAVRSAPRSASGGCPPPRPGGCRSARWTPHDQRTAPNRSYRRHRVGRPDCIYGWDSVSRLRDIPARLTSQSIERGSVLIPRSQVWRRTGRDAEVHLEPGSTRLLPL